MFSGIGVIQIYTICHLFTNRSQALYERFQFCLGCVVLIAVLSIVENYSVYGIFLSSLTPANINLMDDFVENTFFVPVVSGKQTFHPEPAYEVGESRPHWTTCYVLITS